MQRPEAERKNETQCQCGMIDRSTLTFPWLCSRMGVQSLRLSLFFRT